MDVPTTSGVPSEKGSAPDAVQVTSSSLRLATEFTSSAVANDMNSPSISSSPSSSAVVIPTPGKSILKRAPAPQQSLFSRITTRFLPTDKPHGTTDQPLKRAHFILPQIATVYPISSSNPPSTPTLKDEKRAIETREAERRRRVVRANSLLNGIDNESEDDWWSLEKVESFYRECCAGCQEKPDPGISAAFKNAATTNPRTLDLSGIQLTFTSASILSDVFAIEWGLRKLVFRECDLDEQVLKPILHSLLIPNSLTFLSVASNRRLKAPAYRLMGAYAIKASTLQFLDLSQNPLDKKSIEYIIAALTVAPSPGLASLRLDDCALRPGALEALSRVVRTSSLRNISLRLNRINSAGAVALALMIRDYPDTMQGSLSPSSALPSAASSAASSPTSSVISLPNSSPSLPAVQPKPGPLLPPPRHPAPGATSVQTTYTPYVPRSKRASAIPAARSVSMGSPSPILNGGQPVPIITSSSQGGVTTRHPANGNSTTSGHSQGPSAALLDKVRALDSLPRLGALRTLDLKGNDLKGGINYLAQVLKRNRTLKVLNLSDNKLDMTSLVSIAEALKYNSCLETLDISRNPCCGPSLEGIQSLRTAFTLNTALKRLFLSSTGMTAAGAIALAEFLPESTSLLHLDLTENMLDIAGVMALSSGLKANHVMRCLDLNIPPADEEFARDILNSCVRNTEEAAARQNGAGGGLWGMIDESELAKSIRGKGDHDVLVRARTCISQLQNILAPIHEDLNSPSPEEVTTRADSLVEEMMEVVQTTLEPERLEELLETNDQLTGLVAKVKESRVRPKLHLEGLGLGLPVNGAGGDISEEDGSLTPRSVDKGKHRADPEPVEHDKVLTPTSAFMIHDTEDDDDEHGEYGFPAINGEPRPEDNVLEDDEQNTRSKSWVEEEGEVFRKGNVLLGPEEMEGEYAGEDLRRELLDAMVERPPPRPVSDTDDAAVDVEGQDGGDQATPLSSPNPGQSDATSTRPYLPRSRSSSSSINTLSSPTTPTGASSPRPH